MLKTIITFIFVFGLIVIAHEFGHFYFAKRAGILVREFAIGMGPKIFSMHRNGTTYTLRLLPIGGYVRMAGNEEDDEDLHLGMQVVLQLDDNEVVKRINTSKKAVFEGLPLEVTAFDLEDKLFIEGNVLGKADEHRRFSVDHDAMIIEEDGTEVQIAPLDVQFQNAKLSKRVMTNFAGPMNNFILAVILFMIVAFMQGGIPNQNSTVLGSVQKNSPAAVAGLKQGMEITKVDNVKVKTWNELANNIAKHERQVTLTVKDQNQTKTLTLQPKIENNDGKKRAVIGITPAMNHSLWVKVKYGFSETIASSMLIFKALGNLITGFSLDKLGGPVAIFKMSEMAASSGLITVLFFTASLSINLGIINLLPIPALDGGKLALNLYEAIFKKPLDPKKEGILTLIGFALVMLLMLLVTWNDLRRYFF